MKPLDDALWNSLAAKARADVVDYERGFGVTFALGGTDDRTQQQRINADDIATSLYPYFQKIARRLVTRSISMLTKHGEVSFSLRHTGCEVDELANVAYISMCDYLSVYKPEGNFLLYVRTRAIGAMVKYGTCNASLMGIPSYASFRMRHALRDATRNEAIEEVAAQHSNKKTYSDPVASAALLYAAVTGSYWDIWADPKINGQEGNSPSHSRLEGLLEDEDHQLHKDPVLIMIPKILEAVQRLPKPERFVVSNRYGIDTTAKSFEEIGELLSLRRDQVRQIEKKALRNIQKDLKIPLSRT